MPKTPQNSPPSKPIPAVDMNRLPVKLADVTSTFKERGALNRLSALSPDERQRGVIAMSAGNHAQGVAYHARRLGIPATIVMPIGTPMVKVANTKHHGAEVIVTGTTLE